MSPESVSRQNLFEIDGFKTGKIEFPSLHLTLDLSPDLYFRYDGPVRELREYAWTLGDRLYPEEEIILGIDLTRMGGFNKTYYPTTAPIPRGCLMAVKDVALRLNTCNEAHEAAEVAVSLGFARELEAHFKMLSFNLNLDQFTPPEVGIIGWAIGAFIHGYSLERELLVLNDIEDEYGPIIELVKSSRAKIVQFPQKL